MTTALDKLRGMVAAARRDSLIATAEADILDRLARVAEDEDDERLDGALEELGDNLRRALDRCVGVDDDGDDLPSTGCPTCDAVLDTLAECHGMSLCGPTAADVAESARDWIGDLIVERDEARAEVERLRAEVAALRKRPTLEDLLDQIGDADDTTEPDDGWEPGPWWTKDDDDDAVMRDSDNCAAHVSKVREGWYSAATWFAGRHVGEQTFHPARRAAMRWCEAQPEMADVISAYTSAPTVGATDAGPDAPALIVEGDDGTGAREARAVPAAPVSGAEQSCGETGVDRPRDDLRGPDTEDDR